MKIKTLLSASLLLPGLALAAVQEHSGLACHTHRVVPGFYVKAEAGLGRPLAVVKLLVPNLPTQTVSLAFKDTFVGGLGVGYTINEFFRTDLLFGYKRLQLKVDSAEKVRLFSGMLNAYFDGQNATMFTPYVMGGLGITHDHHKKGSNGKTVKGKVRFTWNAGAGVYAKVLDNVNLDLGYKYVSVNGNKGLNDSVRADFTSHDFLVGLVYKF